MAETTFLHEDDEIPSSSVIFHNQVSLEIDLFQHQLEQSHSSVVVPLQNSSFNIDLDRGLGFCTESHDLCDYDDEIDDFGCGFLSADGESSVIADGSRNSVFFNVDVDDEMDADVDDLEWEEVVDENEVMSMFFDADVDDDMDLSVVMEEEELGVEQVSNLGWEMLLNFNNLDPNVDDEYQMFGGEFVLNEVRNPPASRAEVENLKMVVVTKDDEICAICKDAIVVGEKATSLPCLHFYHGCCIETWLGMRNTCPVCRYELPTDDLEYERRRNERGLLRGEEPQQSTPRGNEDLISILFTWLSCP